MMQLTAFSRWPATLELDPYHLARAAERYEVHSPQELVQLARRFEFVERVCQTRGEDRKRPSSADVKRGTEYTLRNAHDDWRRYAREVEAPRWWRDLEASSSPE